MKKFKSQPVYLSGKSILDFWQRHQGRTSPFLFFLCLFFSAQLLLGQETAEFKNAWTKNFLGANANKGSVESQGNSTIWVVEKTANSNEIRLKNNATGGYLNCEKDQKFPAVGNINPEWWSALWVIEPIVGTQQSRIKNKWLNTYLHTEKGGLELGAIQPGWVSAQWEWFRASSITFTPPAPGWVVFANQGAFIAKYDLSYTLNGQPFSFKSGNITVGQKIKYDIPTNATNIIIKGEGQTGLVWEPWKTIFNKQFTSAPNQCFKSFGTTLNQKWDNNCQ
jgi:hypothetical protein